MQREIQDRIARCGDAPDAGVFVVGRENGRAVGGQRVNHRCMFQRHRFNRRHEFLMLALRVVDDSDSRRGDLAERFGFARMIHAEFDHRQLVRFVQPKQRQRQADVIVEIPAVASRALSPTAAARIDAIISLTVVLPLLPVTAISGIVKRLRQPWANAPSATRVSLTLIAGTLKSSGVRVTNAAAMPRCATCGRKVWASKRSPLIAMNRSPGPAVRLSVDTRSNATFSSPITIAPGICNAASRSVNSVIRHLRALAWRERQAPGVRDPDRRKRAFFP